MKTYSESPAEVGERAASLIKKFHPDLSSVGVTIDFVSAVNSDEDEPAVMLNGYACLAVVKIVNGKQRAKGESDAEITIDEARYQDLTEKEKDALIDHELYHLEVQRKPKGQPKLDFNGRPKLKMRKHDRQYGWFDEIAKRHGKHALEVKQATLLFLGGKQTYFGFAIDMPAKEADALLMG